MLLLVLFFIMTEYALIYNNICSKYTVLFFLHLLCNWTVLSCKETTKTLTGSRQGHGVILEVNTIFRAGSKILSQQMTQRGSCCSDCLATIKFMGIYLALKTDVNYMDTMQRTHFVPNTWMRGGVVHFNLKPTWHSEWLDMFSS